MDLLFSAEVAHVIHDAVLLEQGDLALVFEQKAKKSFVGECQF